MARSTRILKDILWILALGGLVAAVFRLWFGLGATTNLSDAVPWGLWKILNMVAGVALSTCGFTVGFLVYVLKQERFRPLMKPAILVAFLGYGAACLALLFDIGIPLRFWHPFIMWNEHSFLFEVFWCVMLYFTVTCIELLPAILTRFRTERALEFLHGIAFGVVVVGISLSSLHHSSLGSLFLVTPQRLHSLWYSPLLPLFFILSAIGAGLMLLVLIRILYARWYDPVPVFGPQWHEGSETTCLLPESFSAVTKPRVEGEHLPMLRTLASIGAGVLAVYLVLKLGDLVWSGTWRDLLAGTWESWLYGIELLLSAIIPILLVVLPGSRRSPIGLGVAAFAASAGLALNRLDVGIFGYWRDAQTVYFPSLAEWSVSLGIIAAAVLAFLAVTENFPIFHEDWQRYRLGRSRFRAAFDTISQVWTTALTNGLQRVSLIGVLVLPLAWVTMYPAYRDQGPIRQAVQPPVGLDVERTNLRLDGNRAGVFVDFHHGDHQRRLGGELSCVKCHHISLPGDRSTPCSRCHRDMVRTTDIFDHFGHMEAVAHQAALTGIQPVNRTCAVCHVTERGKTGTDTKSCYECHKQDMWLTGDPDENLNLALASSFQDAMHGTCVCCHRKEQKNVNRANLAECGTCHKSFYPQDVLLASGKPGF